MATVELKKLRNRQLMYKKYGIKMSEIHDDSFI